jgi:hypothetical protein
LLGKLCAGAGPLSKVARPITSASRQWLSLIAMLGSLSWRRRDVPASVGQE